MLNKLKDDILRLLKEDEEFRYAVIGLLGLQRLEEAIVRLSDAVTRLIDIQTSMESRLSKLEDAVARLVDIQAKIESRLVRVEEEQMGIKARTDRLEEAVARLSDTVARLVDIQARMESRLTKVEEAVARLTDSHIELGSIVARLADIQARQEERLAKVEERLIKVEERLEEHDRKFNEIITELRDLRRVSDEHTKILQVHTRMLDKYDRRFNDVIGMMYHGFEQLGRFAGISLESLVRSILTKAMQESGELSKDKEITNITIDGEEIDIFCDDPLIVGEVTSYADSIDEVYKLIKSGLIRARFKKEPRLMLVITNIKKEAYEDIVREAEANGIEVIAGKRV